MTLRLEVRPQPSRAMAYLAPVLAIALTLIAGSVMFLMLGFDPAGVLYALFIQPVSSLYGLSELGVKATPLALIAIGLALGFRANVWNIGAEGQLTVGALAGSGLALAFYGEEGPLLLPAMLVAGVLGGMAWAAIPAFLRTRFNANEILTSLMLTYIAGYLLSWLVHGPWKDPEGFNFPESRMFGVDLPSLIPGTRLHLGALFALLAMAGAWLLAGRTLVGFQIRVVGLAPPAALYAGFSQKRIVWLCFLISGGLAGLAGICEVAGPIGQLRPTISPGYGFTAIIVAFLGRLHPLGILLAALLMALSYLGGEAVQISMRLPLAVAGVFQGMLLFFLLAVDLLVGYRLRWRRPAPAERPIGQPAVEAGQ